MFIPTPAESLPVLRVLGQLANTYIVAEGPDGLYLIDQHAAHERVLFEQVERDRRQQATVVQNLLVPATLEVSPQQEEALKWCCETLAEFGFAIEPFGDRTYVVRAVPALLYQDWMEMLRELLDSLCEGSKGDLTGKIEISMSCHRAVKAGQVLSHDELCELVRQLEKVSLPQTCPHGRPTMIHLSSARLRREFRRS
jgi:DNA mismatch repair protein MutL